MPNEGNKLNEPLDYYWATKKKVPAQEDIDNWPTNQPVSFTGSSPAVVDVEHEEG